MRWFVRATPALVLAAAAASTHAQCAPGWVGSIGTPSFSTTVRTTAVMPNGDVIAGGSSGTIGTSTPINRVARYNPVTDTWSSVGLSTASNNTVQIVQPLPNGDILAGGGFTQLGGVAINMVGRYSAATNTWSDLGYGTNGGAVFAILPMPNGDFYIGGNFQRVAGVLRQHVSRWNAATATWSSLNTGMNSTGDDVQCLALAQDGTIIAGGAFLSATGAAGSPHIARYNPATNTWSGLGGGVNNTVMDVHILANGDIIAAGYFNTAGGVPANRIARYTPATNTWAAIGTGVGSSGAAYVKDICPLPDGTFVVGGDFSLAGGLVVTDVARCDPATNTWSALAPGLNGDVEQMAVMPSGDLVIAGSFGSRIGQWSFGAGNPAITQPPADTAVCSGSPVTLSVTATGATSYEWRFNGSPIDTVLNPSAATAALFIPSAGTEHHGLYDCTAIGPCGSTTSSAAVLTVNAADFNGDGDIGTDGDIEAFFACLGGNCCASCGTPDFNTDGDVGTDGDIESFFRVLGGGAC